MLEEAPLGHAPVHLKHTRTEEVGVQVFKLCSHQ
jgi:hypothetical protein